MAAYRSIPQRVRSRITECSSDTVHIGNVRAYTPAEIASGALAHLNIGWAESGPTFESQILPAATRGRWSKWNREGKVVVRRDLPKVWKSWGWESPNFGDWSKGSHSVSFTREVYERELRYGQGIPLNIEVHGNDDGTFMVGVKADVVFDRTGLNEQILLLACSLIRENTNGHAEVISTDLTTEQWLQDQRVHWEFLPPGSGTFAGVASRFQVRTDDPRYQELKERFEIVQSMGTPAIIAGNSGFSRYVGFMFRDDLVVLENLAYGNAIYVLYADWQAVSRRSRIDLLADSAANYDRIVHAGRWKEALRMILMLHGQDPSSTPTAA